MERTERELAIDGDEHIAATIEQPDGGADATVVFAHGFGSDRAGSYRRRAEIAVEMGLRSVRFDFRGNNESSRSFEAADLTTRIQDLRRVLDELDGPVGVYGSSFGGLVAVHTAAHDDRIDSLVLRAPVTFMELLDDIREAVEADGRYEQLPGKHVGPEFVADIDEYDTETVIEDITVPTMIMHGMDDAVVPQESSRRFFERLSCEKQYIGFEGEGHRFSDETDERAVRIGCNWILSSGD